MDPTLAKIVLGMILMACIVAVVVFIMLEIDRRKDRFLFQDGSNYYVLKGKNIDGNVRLRRPDGVKILIGVPKGIGQSHIKNPHRLYNYDELGTPMVMVRNSPPKTQLLPVKAADGKSPIYIDAHGQAHALKPGQRPSTSWSEWQVRPIGITPVDGLGRYPSEFRPYSATWNERMAETEAWKNGMDGGNNSKFRLTRGMILLMILAGALLLGFGYLLARGGGA